MTRRDKTRGLRHAATIKRQATILRAETALIQLQKEGKAINYNIVSQAAKVSKAWLYINLKQQIDVLRQNTKGALNVSQKSSTNESKHALLLTLKKRIKELENENKALRQQLEVAYGYIAVKE